MRHADRWVLRRRLAFLDQVHKLHAIDSVRESEEWQAAAASCGFEKSGPDRKQELQAMFVEDREDFFKIFSDRIYHEPKEEKRVAQPPAAGHPQLGHANSSRAVPTASQGQDSESRNDCVAPPRSTDQEAARAPKGETDDTDWGYVEAERRSLDSYREMLVARVERADREFEEALEMYSRARFLPIDVALAHLHTTDLREALAMLGRRDRARILESRPDLLENLNALVSTHGVKVRGRCHGLPVAEIDRTEWIDPVDADPLALTVADVLRVKARSRSQVKEFSDVDLQSTAIPGWQSSRDRNSFEDAKRIALQFVQRCIAEGRACRVPDITAELDRLDAGVGTKIKNDVIAELKVIYPDMFKAGRPRKTSKIPRK
jgi:hypothetical protein